MLLIRTFVKPSKIDGLGLFAAADIKPGTVWWRYSDIIDKVFSEAEFGALAILAQEHVQRSGYRQNGFLCNVR